MRKPFLLALMLAASPATQAVASPGTDKAPESTALAEEAGQPVDPALLVKAQPIAAIVLPDGTMARMMGPMMQKMLKPMMDSVSKMPIRHLLEAGGLDPDQTDKLSAATVKDVMEILDPAFHERMTVMTETMFPALGRFMSQFEPDMREGMAEAFAGRYTAPELDEINAFLHTPTGAKFGSGFMMLATDPHYIGKMQTIVPKMMEAMPSIMKETSAALAKLPKPRKYEDLSKAERDRLAELLGADPKKMKP